MILKAYIENYGDTLFDLVDGGVVKSNFNETLDSATINITNLSTKLELFPYQYVRLVSTDNSFSRYLIIDNFVESIENLDDGIYDYVINLASPLKILEKVQLPNRTIIHSLVESRQKIGTIIDQMMSLYCPKVKYEITSGSWDYRYIFDWQSVVNDSKLANTDCPDLSFNAPTLREVITTLMLVVGYLPTINHRTLSFIDLREIPKEFKIQDGRIFNIKRSNSSDSYVNTLQVQANNVLDTENKVVNEMIGFRDREKVFLKHTENLKLETRFPIESVEKLEIRSFVSMWLVGNENIDLSFSLNPPSTLEIFAENSPIFVSSLTSKTFTNVVAKFYKVNNFGIRQEGNSNILTFNSIPTLVQTRNYASITVSSGNDFIIAPSPSVDYSYIVLSYEYNGLPYSFASFSLVSSHAVEVFTYLSKDLTDIVFEEGKRKLLNKDYNLIAQQVPYERFKEFYYLTLSYQYGGRTIDGFSNKWEEFTWFGESNQNFMETLWNTITVRDTALMVEQQRRFEEVLDLPYNYFKSCQVVKTNADFVGSNKSKFSLFFFSISYRPFNEVNIRYTKEIEEIPFTIEQLDKQEASIPMLDEFSHREQDKINRLGNNVLQIHQSQASDFSYINDLNTLYEDSTIFSREIAFYDDSFEVNYVATKNYVLKNYFTALQTKYRAYEYVDFNQTIKRNENKKIFVCIATTYFNGDDHIIYGTLGSTNTYTPPFLYSALLRYTKGEDETFKYQIDGMYNLSPLTRDYLFYKNDLSVITHKNNISFTSAMYDSVSNGIYVESNNEINLGGYTQGWYLNEYYEKPQMCLYTNKSLDYLFGNETDLYSEGEVGDYSNISLELPKLNSLENLLNVEYLRYAENRSSRAKIYYKSQNEVLSQTLQFEYYTEKKESGKPYYEWTEKFVELNSAVFDRSKGEMRIYGFAEPTELVEEPQDSISGTLLSNYATIVRIVTNRGIRFHLSNMFNQISGTTRYHCLYRTFKIVWYDETNGKSYDVFAIQIDESISSSDYADIQKYNNGNLNAYFSMNDTKTNKVYQVNATSGLWEQSKEIAVNTTTRILK